MQKRYLLTPGPTPLPPEVVRSQAQPIIHHRTEEFEQIFAVVRQDLKYVFQTNQDVLILASSGTGAMEAAVTNLHSAEDDVLVISGGKFGQRWGQIASCYGLKPTVIEVEWGQAVDPAKVAQALAQNPQIKTVFCTYSETSTGALIDVKALAAITSKTDTLLVVDSITATGVVPLPMDEWGVDVVISGSQKAFMLPPGLGFITLSKRAWKRTETAKLPSFYFNLTKERKNQVTNQTAYTPAITLIIALKEALELIRKEGLDKVFTRHQRLANATIAGVKALGLELFAAACPSLAVTAVKAPANIDAGKIVKAMKKYGVTIAGGQDHLKGKIFRVSHLGYVDTFDVIIGISALEMALKEAGYAFEMGSGVKAAQEVLLAG
ncbi:MAG: alanine--glyoxylate aminotransferase family protein [Candidatus Schekmanbacteria bacterium]|nr:alanine--glyoxylate aminotransferase family protein [Candidatus Schekmanbacteria bacterium]